MEIIIERVRPQYHSALPGRCGRSGYSAKVWNAIFPGPALESGASELGHGSLRRQIQNALQNLAKPRRIAEEICEPRNFRSQLRPAVDHSKRICMQRAGPVFVIMGQEFRFVCG